MFKEILEMIGVSIKAKAALQIVVTPLTRARDY